MSRHAGTAILLFLLFQALYALTLSGNAFRVPDEFEVYFQIEHLVDAGDISVPQTLAIRQPVVVNGRVTGSQSIFFGKVGLDGRPYAPYGPLAALLAMPHHLIARGLAWLGGVPRRPLPGGIAWVFLVGAFTSLSSATGAAAAVAGFHRAAIALRAERATALGLALLLGGASVLWTYGTCFYSEAWQAAAFVWAAALLLEARDEAAGNAGARVGAAALLLVAAGLTKVTSLVFMPGFVAAVLVDGSLTPRARARVALLLTGAIALAAAIHMAWNGYRFGNPFDFGYDWSETVPRLPPQAFRIGDLPRGLVVLLASPGKSIFVWAPPLILAAASARRFWEQQRAVAIGLAATAGIGLVFYGAYLFPEGGYSHGPRHLVPIVPLLLLPATARPLQTWPRGVVMACAISGVAIAVLAASVSFLEDQALGADVGAGARLAYYERIDPPPGRAWNRYRLAYVPFVATLTSGHWLQDGPVGQGPDFLPRHLARARRLMPGGQTIPMWLVWLPPLGWLLLLAASGAAMFGRGDVGRADPAGPPSWRA